MRTRRGFIAIWAADYADNIVRSAARSAVPDSTSQFTFEEAYSSKRAAMAEKIRTRMNGSINEILRQYPGFSGAGVVIQQVFIREVKPSAQLLTAIEQKMTAQQQAQQMDFTLEKERKEAQRKAIEAQGIQDFQNIVTKGITEPLLKWKGIEATKSWRTPERQGGHDRRQRWAASHTWAAIVFDGVA